MSVIYLWHPEHGAKVATLEAEAEADKASGWRDMEPAKPAVPAPIPSAQRFEPIPAPRQPRRS